MSLSRAAETLNLQTLQAWTDDLICTVKKSEAYNNVSDLFDELKSNRKAQSSTLLAVSTALGIAAGPFAMIVTVPVRLAHAATDQTNQDLFTNLASCKHIKDKDKRIAEIEKHAYRYLREKFPNVDLSNIHHNLQQKLKASAAKQKTAPHQYASEPLPHRPAPPVPEAPKSAPEVPPRLSNKNLFTPAVPPRPGTVKEKVARIETSQTRKKPH